MLLSSTFTSPFADGRLQLDEVDVYSCLNGHTIRGQSCRTVVLEPVDSGNNLYT